MESQPLHSTIFCCVDLSSDDEGEVSTTVSGVMESDDESSESFSLNLCNMFKNFLISRISITVLQLCRTCFCYIVPLQ